MKISPISYPFFDIFIYICSQKTNKQYVDSFHPTSCNDGSAEVNCCSQSLYENEKDNLLIRATCFHTGFLF